MILILKRAVNEAIIRLKMSFAEVGLLLVEFIFVENKQVVLLYYKIKKWLC